MVASNQEKKKGNGPRGAKQKLGGVCSRGQATAILCDCFLAANDFSMKPIAGRAPTAPLTSGENVWFDFLAPRGRHSETRNFLFNRLAVTPHVKPITESAPSPVELCEPPRDSPSFFHSSSVFLSLRAAHGKRRLQSLNCQR